MFFLLAFFSTMAIMNFYFHFKFAKGGLVHKGKIKDINNTENGLILSIILNNDKVVSITTGKKMTDEKFYKFVEKNLGNPYDVLEVTRNGTTTFIHNGSYLFKAILFTLGSIGLLVVMYLNN